MHNYIARLNYETQSMLATYGHIRYLKNQVNAFGRPSEMIRDYTERKNAEELLWLRDQEFERLKLLQNLLRQRAPAAAAAASTWWPSATARR